jgi:hypothetical protein
MVFGFLSFWYDIDGGSLKTGKNWNLGVSSTLSARKNDVCFIRSSGIGRWKWRRGAPKNHQLPAMGDVIGSWCFEASKMESVLIFDCRYNAMVNTESLLKWHSQASVSRPKSNLNHVSEISCFVLQLLLMREDIEKELKDLINAFQAEETSNFGGLLCWC